MSHPKMSPDIEAPPPAARAPPSNSSSVGDGSAGTSDFVPSSHNERVKTPGASHAVKPTGIVGAIPVVSKDEYQYLDIEDPDKSRTELPCPTAAGRFRRAVDFITRGHAVPWKQLAMVTIWAVFAVVASYFTGLNWEGNKGDNCKSRWWCSPISVDGSAIGYLGFALFLLLGFRVNESYARYMDGVRLWVDIRGHLRVFFMHISQAFERGLFHEKDRERICGLCAAFAVCLKRELREETDLRELKTMLGPSDLAGLQLSQEMSKRCLFLLNSYLVAAAQNKELKLPGPWHAMMMGILNSLSDKASNCKRIQQFKFAYGYAAHLRVFLCIWLCLLPLSLTSTSGWFTIALVPIIAHGILGAQSSADEMSDPFGFDYNDIRLGLITEDVIRDLRLIYRQSIDASYSPHDTPDPLDVPFSEGGNLPDVNVK